MSTRRSRRGILAELGIEKFKGNWFVWHRGGLEWMGVSIDGGFSERQIGNVRPVLKRPSNH